MFSKEELEEAKKWLEENIKYYKEQIKFIEATDCDLYEEEYELYKKRIKIFKIIANYIDNSISKEVIEKKVGELNEEYEQLRETSDFVIADVLQPKIQVLQELLEGK